MLHAYKMGSHPGIIIHAMSHTYIYIHIYIYTHIYRYTYIGSTKKFSRVGSIIRNNDDGGFKFVVVYGKSNFFGRVGRENIFWIMFFNMCLSYNYYEIGFCSIGLTQTIT